MVDIDFQQDDADCYRLTLDGNEGQHTHWLTTTEAVQLYETVREELDEYVAERDAAKREYDAGARDFGEREQDERECLDPRDPKRPGYADDLLAQADQLRDQRRGL